MKRIILTALIFTSSLSFAQTICENGFAGDFPCENYDLMAILTLDEMDADSGSDSWGWTDPDTGKEYALMGLNNGTAFVDISDPVNIVYLGKLPTHNNFTDFGQIWRDIKVFNNHAFIVSEIGGHGMQIFDLTRLRDVTNPPVTFDEDAHYDNFGNAHNIAINEETGFAYALGTQTFSGGGHYINVNNPVSPIAAGGSSISGYTHDAQIITYNGPDADYTGRELYFGCNVDKVIIMDVTDKSNPQLISSVSYSSVGYTHQGWLTEDQSLFIMNDEADEVLSGFNTRTLIFDVSDLDNPFYKFDDFGPTPATDHNLYIKDDKAYLSNYSEGLRVVNISDIQNENITQVGFFDTYPEDNITGTENGIWSSYPFFNSKNIVLSDYNRGLFIVRESGTLSTEDLSDKTFSLTPNPAKNIVAVAAKNDKIKTIEIFNVLGQLVESMDFTPTITKNIDISGFTSGIYLFKINTTTIVKLIKE